MKLKRMLAAALVLCFVIPLAGCGRQALRGSGNVAEKTLQLPERPEGCTLRIAGISIRGGKTGVTLVVDESLADEAVITADDNILQHLDASCSADGEIVIQGQGRGYLPTKLTITVGVPVNALNIGGAWKFSYNCPSVTECTVSASGAASGELTFGSLASLQVKLSGAGDLILHGSAAQANISISGAASIKAFGLAVQHAKINISGAGHCEIAAEETLYTAISGAGSVVYDGSPAVARRISGIGSVKKK